MAYTQLENHPTAPAWTLLARFLVCGTLSLGWLAISANAQDAQPEKKESWTTTSESSQPNAAPMRTSESHTQSGNRTVDKQRVEMRGPNGYQPSSETETETIRVDDNTTRTVVRTYTWDGNGQRKLLKQSEEDSRSAASGDAHVVRTTSSSDVNGHLQVVQREVSDTKKTGPDTQETKTTLYTTDNYGSLSPSRQVQETQKVGADHKIEARKTTLIPDGNGKFKVGEVQEKTITEDGNKRTSDERISRPDLDGHLSEVSRSVSDETENASGEVSKTVDTYSTAVPGFTGDGRLHHNQRITTVQKKDSSGEVIEQQIEAPNPGNPTDHPQVQTRTKYTVRYAASGTEQTRTTQTRDASGNLNLAGTETKKSDQPPPAATPAPPAQPSQQNPPPKPN